MKRWMVLLAALLLVLALVPAAAEGGDNWLATMLGAQEAVGYGANRASLAFLYIEGELIEGDAYYDHAGTLDAIDALCYDEKNSALLLVINTPGGGLYESDELHHAISVYKEMTGRPVYAYMKQECCSGGVYAAMAADTIFASRMSVTGSVGVYVETYSEAGLLEKLGIEREYISTGKNKVSGYPTLTEDQRAIEQAMVNEGFEFFKDVIRSGRGLTDEQMAPFLDGRLLTALQAKEFGLIDDVLYYDEALARIERELGGDVSYVDITPEWEMSFEDMITQSIMDMILP